MYNSLLREGKISMPNLPEEKPGIGSPEKRGLLSRFFPEKYPIVASGEVPPTAAEKEGYLERVEDEVELKWPITDDQGKIIATPPSAGPVKIVLSMSEERFFLGLHRPVSDAWRWLSEWTRRMMRIFPGQTTFEKE